MQCTSWQIKIPASSSWDTLSVCSRASLLRTINLLNLTFTVLLELTCRGRMFMLEVFLWLQQTRNLYYAKRLTVKHLQWVFIKHKAISVPGLSIRIIRIRTSVNNNLSDMKSEIITNVSCLRVWVLLETFGIMQLHSESWYVLKIL